MKILIFIFIIIILVVLIFILGLKIKNKSINRFNPINLLRKQNKEKAKNKIMHHINEIGEITNNQVQIILKISDATATRYLEELEKESKIKQVGQTGRNVKYIIKP